MRAPEMRQHAGAVLGAVEAALRSRGFTRLYGGGGARYGVLSVTGGLTIWCDGRALTWQRPDGRQAAWPATDPSGAAARLAALARPGGGPHDPETREHPGQGQEPGQM